MGLRHVNHEAPRKVLRTKANIILKISKPTPIFVFFKASDSNISPLAEWEQSTVREIVLRPVCS